MGNFPIVVIMASIAGYFASSGYSLIMPVQPNIQSQPMIIKNGVVVQNRSDCVIKGNIQISTGKHIYHVPGQAYYAQTIISPSKGERWFCSEAEAQAAGWRKSKM